MDQTLKKPITFERYLQEKYTDFYFKVKFEFMNEQKKRKATYENNRRLKIKSDLKQLEKYI